MVMTPTQFVLERKNYCSGIVYIIQIEMIIGRRFIRRLLLS